jgi:hypothetical protein
LNFQRVCAMSKKIFLYLFFFLFVVVAAAVYLFNAGGARQGNLWQMLPNTPALVLQTDHTGNLLDKIHRTGDMEKALLSTKGFRPVYRQLCFIDSLFSPKTRWTKAFSDGELMAAVYPGKNQFLFLLKAPKLPNIETLKNFLESALSKKYVVLYNHPANYPVTVIKIFNTTNEKSWWLWKTDGVLLFTSQEKLMEASVSGYTMQEMHFSDSQGFRTVAKTGGKLVDARLYIYYPVLGKMLSDYANPRFSSLPGNFSRFAGWSETDIILQDKGIIFSGYTEAGGHSGLAKFHDQHPVTMNAITLFPFNTTFFVIKGFSDFSTYATRNIASHFKTVYQSDIEKLIRLTGKETALVSNALNSKELPQKSWVLVQLKDIPKAEKLLGLLALKSGNPQVYKSGNYRIRKIGIKDFLPTLYGKTFSAVKQNYYCIANGFAVFANSKTSLEQLLQYSQTGKTLDLDVNYQAFSGFLANRSNLLTEFRPGSMKGLWDYFLNRNGRQLASEIESFLQNLQGVAFQYSCDGDLFYTNFYFRYNKTFRNENLALWKVRLHDEIVGKPFLVKDHRTHKYDIIVFDRGNRMYLIDPTGKIRWTRRLPGLPMSPIYPVDYYKNGKIQYLFNTRNSLFLIDRNGNFTANYPIALHPRATNGLSLFDYTRRKDYRILLAQADKRIYDYQINGNEVKGWQKPQMPGFVSQKVVRLLAGHKDYIIINDDKNHVKIVNRRGQQRIFLKAPVNKAIHSGYFVNKTNSKGIILTTNTSGKLVYITTSGKLRYTDFGKFSPEHYFLYDDFNGDGYKDFIFVDKNKLQVFDRFKKLLFSYTFDQNITVQPEFFKLGNRQRVLGIVASKEKTIYLFDSKGNILINKGLTGETPFTVGSLNNNSEVNIITATGNMLYNYRIK